MPELLIGVDVGTGSSKGVLVGPDGTVLAVAVRGHAMSLPRTGHAEMDAEAVWWGELGSISRELLETPGVEAGSVAGICVSGLGPCLVPTDSDYRPLRPAILYGIDTRADAEVVELTESIGADALLARGGKLLSSQAVGPKLVWLRRSEPEVWSRTRRWLGCSSYLVAKLTGEYVMDHHTASQCDPLYDLVRHEWARDHVAEIVGHVEMPRLVWPTEVVGTVTPEASQHTGLEVGTRVCAGSVDVLAEAVSCGVRRPGDLMLMYGSTMFFLQLLAELQTHPLLWATTGLDDGSHAITGGMATSGSLIEWVRDLTGGVDYPTLTAEAAGVPAGAEGLLVLPFFAGERTPVFDPHARGVVAGLTLRHTRGHLFRAAYEGIAFGLRQSLAVLKETCGPAARVVAVGGGTSGRLWTQIVADVTGERQLLPAQAIGASYGDGLMAAVGTGLVPLDTDWTRISDEVVPDPANADVYDALFAQYAALYPATRDQVHHLATLQEALTLDPR